MNMKLFRVIFMATLCFLVSASRVYAAPISAELDLGKMVFARDAITKEGEMTPSSLPPLKPDVVSRSDPKTRTIYNTPVTIIYQQQSCWCWAASIEMVLNYHKVSETQEKIVEKTFGRDAFGDPKNHGATIRDISFAINQWYKDKNEKLYRIMGTFSPMYSDEKLLIREIRERHKPTIITYEQPPQIDGNSVVIKHAVVLSGLSVENDKISKIILRDPWKSSDKVSPDGRVEKDRDFLKYVTGVWYIDVDVVEL